MRGERTACRVPGARRWALRRPGPSLLPHTRLAACLCCLPDKRRPTPHPPKSGPACVCLDRETGEGTSCEFQADLRGLSVPACPWGPPGEAAR